MSTRNLKDYWREHKGYCILYSVADYHENVPIVYFDRVVEL